MPKQTFLTKDFFVNASENEVQQKILALPQSLQHIKFLKENTAAHTYRFSYKLADNTKDSHIDVSILPLHEHQVKITLRCSYADLTTFIKDPYIDNVLENFESAIKACVTNTMADYKINNLKRRPFQKILQYFTVSIICLGIAYFIAFL